MILASIDIGSNTVLLLIAEVDIKYKTINTLINHYQSPRISAEILPGSNISDQRINDLFKVLEDYNYVINEYKCENVFVTATNSFRIAKNSKNISTIVKNRFGWDVNIISGDEEAELSFYGAAFPFRNQHEEKIVIDIGGGSTEITFGNSSRILYLNSFNIGVVSLTEIASKKEFDSKNYLLNLFNEVKTFIPPGIKTIAVAGTPTTLTCINQNIRVYKEDLVDNSVLTLENIKSIFYTLETMTPEEIINRYGNVVEGRADVLTSGTLILLTLMEVLKLNEIIVSSKGLRYGVVMKYLMSS